MPSKAAIRSNIDVVRLPGAFVADMISASDIFDESDSDNNKISNVTITSADKIIRSGTGALTRAHNLLGINGVNKLELETT